MKNKLLVLAIVCLGLGVADLLYLNLEVLPSLWSEPDVTAVTKEAAPARTPAQSPVGTTAVAELDRPAASPLPLEQNTPPENQGEDMASMEQAKPNATEFFNNTVASIEPSTAPATFETGKGSSRLLRETMVNFEHGSHQLSPKYRKQLGEMLGTIEDLDRVRVEIDGHTDRTGTRIFDNQRLSLQRAEAVASFLVQKGVDAQHITTRGHGASQPLDFDDDPNAFAKNRRAEIRILKDKS